MAKVKLVFDGEKLCFVRKNAETNRDECVKAWRARSGVLDSQGKTRTSVAAQKEKNRGPIPEGAYTVSVEELEKSYETSGPNKGKKKTGKRLKDWMRNPKAWGDTRVLIKPKPGTKTHGRDGFFTHGGATFGSSGCIDLNCASKSFFEYWEGNFDEKGVSDAPVDLIVDYSGKAMPAKCEEPDAPTCSAPSYSMIPGHPEREHAYACFVAPLDELVVRQGEDLDIVAVGWAPGDVVDMLIEYRSASAECFSKLAYHFGQDPKDPMIAPFPTDRIPPGKVDIRITSFSRSGEMDSDCRRFWIEPTELESLEDEQRKA